MAQQIKNPPAMQETKETWVQSLGQEDPRRRKWQLDPVFFPKKSHGHRNLAGYSPKDCKRDRQDWVHMCYDAVKVLHSTCQQIWNTQQWPQDWKRSVFIPIPKKGNAKECSNYHTIALISHAKSLAWLSDFPFTFHFHALEKEMATHSSVLAWRIPGMGERGGLLSMGSHRVGHDWSDLAGAAAAMC